MAIRLQLLLQRGRRDDESIRAVRQALGGLGMHPTVSGAATVAAEIEPAEFERLFGRKPEEQPAPGDALAVGGPAGADLPIPDSLRDYVASITVAPQYIRMAGTADQE